MLEPDPEKRITAKEALEHEYFTGTTNKADLEEEIGTTLEERLHNFNAFFQKNIIISIKPLFYLF